MIYTTGVDLASFLRADAPLPAPQAALFASDLAAQLAAVHATGRAHGPLESGVRVDPSGDRPRPVIVESAPPGVYTPAHDVAALGVLLGHLLGARMDRDGQLVRPDGVSAALWDLVVACLEPDARARPAAAVLAGSLRDAARDILLGMAPWPAVSPTAQAGPAPPEFVPRAEQEQAAPPNRRRPGALALGGIAAAVVLVGAGVLVAIVRPFSAAGTSAETCLPPDCAARVTFTAGDAVLKVCDNKQDGQSALALYRQADQPDEKGVWASSGSGTCVDHDTGIPKGTTITFRACLGDRPENRVNRCGDPVTGTA
jgi:hypothetical protein